MIINMTPHQVTVVDAEGNIIRTYPKGETMRDPSGNIIGCRSLGR